MRSIVWSAVLLSYGATVGFAQSGTPTIDPNLGVQNQGNFKGGESVAAGSFVAIFGTNIASSLTLADTVPLSNQLANVSVTFNNVPAPMVAVGHNVNAAGDDQINAQVPWEVTPGTAQVVVTRGNASSAAANVSIISVAPGLMQVGTPDSTGVLRPVVYHNSDSNLAWPANAFPGGSPARPASLSDPNDTLVLLATGLGALNTTPPDGAPPPLVNGQVVLDNTKETPNITVGGVPVTILFSGASPQFPSLYQVNFKLGSGTPTGNAVAIIIKSPSTGLQSRPDLMIAITN